MYGPGPLPPAPVPVAPPRPPAWRTAARVALRLVLCCIPVASIGLLAWVPLVRLAILRRRTRDWAACGALALLCTAGLMLAGYSDNDRTWQSVVGVLILFSVAALSPIYYLAAELRWYHRHSRASRGEPPLPGYLPPPAYRPPAAYVPPPPPAPYPAAPYRTQHRAPAPYQDGVSHQDAAPYRDAAPARPRIERVRAELDELSAYLRAQEER